MREHLIPFPREFESQPNAKALLWLRKSATHRFSRTYRALLQEGPIEAEAAGEPRFDLSSLGQQRQHCKRHSIHSWRQLSPLYHSVLSAARSVAK